MLPHDDCTPAGGGQPAIVERHGDEIRESYLDRDDRLSFRVDNGTVEHRFFSNGRPDSVKEVVEDRGAQKVHIKFGMRAKDGCVSLAFYPHTGSNSWVYDVFYSDRPNHDGLLSVSIATRNGPLNVMKDSAGSVFRTNLAHIAVKQNPDVRAEFKKTTVQQPKEIYQDLLGRRMRLTVIDEKTYGDRTLSFSNDEPTDDDRYTESKIQLLELLESLVDLQREIYVNLLPFEPNQTNADFRDAQKRRFKALSESLFAAVDEATKLAR